MLLVVLPSVGVGVAEDLAADGDAPEDGEVPGGGDLAAGQLDAVRPGRGVAPGAQADRDLDAPDVVGLVGLEQVVVRVHVRLEPVLPGRQSAHVDLLADLGPEESGWRDADDGERDSIEQQRLADRVRRAAEPLLPVVVADHGGGTVRRAPPVVCVGEGPPEDGGDAQDVEEPSARVQAVDELGLSRRRGVEAVGRPCGRAVEEGRTVTNLFPDRIRPRVAVLVEGDDRELLRRLHRQRPQHQRVEDRKNRRVGADPQRERQDRDGGDDRRRAQRAIGVAEISH